MVKSTLVEEVETYLMANLDKLMRDVDLPGPFCATYATIAKHFHIKNNLTISKWFEGKKMQYASELLRARLSVKEVACRTGYSGSSSFINAFINYWKETPAIHKTRLYNGVFSLQRIQAFLLGRLSEKYDISALQDAFPMSYIGLNKQFQKLMGMGVKAWFSQMRIEKAQSLFSEGRTKKEVVKQLGFKDTMALNALFRRHALKLPASDAGRNMLKDNQLHEGKKSTVL